MNILLKAGRGLPFGQGYVSSKMQNKSSLSTMSSSGLLRRQTPRNDGIVRRGVDHIIIIFCVLFSGLLAFPAFGQEADGLKLDSIIQGRNYNYKLYNAVSFQPINSERYRNRALERYPKADLKKFPIGMYYVDTLKISPVRIGDKIPDELWDLPLWIVNDANGRDTTTLRLEADKEWLIIDLWADFCPPCVKSMAKWEKRFAKADANFVLLGNFDSSYIYQAVPSCRRFDYKSTQIVGGSASLVHHLFLWNDKSTGPTIWIKDGRLFGISYPEVLSEGEYQDILSGKLTEIPSHAAYKYSSN